MRLREDPERMNGSSAQWEQVQGVLAESRVGDRAHGIGRGRGSSLAAPPLGIRGTAPEPGGRSSPKRTTKGDRVQQGGHQRAGPQTPRPSPYHLAWMRTTERLRKDKLSRAAKLKKWGA